jgi:ABC-type Fe3+ transport system permease subunit
MIFEMGMRVIRWLGRWAGTGLWVVVLAPALALLPAAVLDRGPGGTVRPTLFPMALSALDPLLWDCVRNSVTVAVIVAVGSVVLGTALAHVGVRWRFWGRPVLTALAIALLAVPPLFGAIGLRRLAAPTVAFATSGRLDGFDPSALAGWVGWVWVGLASGVPLVVLAATAALERIDPAWVDSARLVGAGPRRIWRDLVWPIVRPEVARAGGMVFALTLIEPGAPLALGLRRTLAYQVVESALGRELTPRAPLLALAAVAIALIGRVLVRWWGGPAATGGSYPEVGVARPEIARWPRATVYVALAAIGLVLAWLPIVALLASLSSLPRPADMESTRLLLNSLALGVAVVLIDLALSWTLAAWAGRRHAWVLSLAAWPELLPPLALGVGALMLPGLLEMGADWGRADGMGRALARGARVLADLLDLDRSPGLLLVLAVSAARLPFLARAVEHGRSRDRLAQIDSALTLGASPLQARRTASGLWRSAAPGALLMTFALAATDVAAALILAPTIECRPIAPGILILADEPGDGLPRAALLAGLALAVNLIALAIASTSRAVRLGDWFRG